MNKNLRAEIRITEEQKAIVIFTKMSYAQVFEMGIQEVLKLIPEIADRKLEEAQKMKATVKKYTIEKNEKNEKLDSICAEFKQLDRKIDDVSKANQGWIRSRLEYVKGMAVGDFILYYKLWEIQQEAMTP